VLLGNLKIKKKHYENKQRLKTLKTRQKW